MSARRPLIAGNWKMNLGPSAGTELARAIRDGLPAGPLEADLVLAPSFVTLPAVAAELSASGIGVAAQNMHAAASGAFTGEVASSQLREAGADWVILGHSERRHVFGEKDGEIAAKCLAASENGLMPILCLGETLEERDADRTLEIVLGQLQAGLADLGLDRSVTLAYEPVWAIGTGRTATPGQAQEVHLALRSGLAGLRGEDFAAKTRILYGGSVKPDNVAAILACEDVDGALVGGASLKADSFLALIPPFPVG